MNKLLAILTSVGCGIALNSCAVQAANELSLDNQQGPFLCEASASVSNYKGAFLENFLRLHQGSKGWLYRDMDLRLSFGPNHSGYQQLQELQQALRSKGTTLVMVPIPVRTLVHPQYLGDIKYDVAAGRIAYQEYLQKLRAIGIVVPKLETIFSKSQGKPMFFARDHHWNHHGARTVARLTAQALRESEGYRTLPKQTFNSHRLANEHNNGSFQRAAKILCEQSFASESFKVYHTEATQALDLFADLAMPEVVLVGTSNSKGSLQFNFDGFLRQYAKVAVLNQAISGGGFGEALRRYIESDMFRESAPKFLVWEMPSYYHLNDTTYFTELLSALGDDV